jgi:hypothetical protein
MKKNLTTFFALLFSMSNLFATRTLLILNASYFVTKDNSTTFYTFDGDEIGTRNVRNPASLLDETARKPQPIRQVIHHHNSPASLSKDNTQFGFCASVEYYDKNENILATYPFDAANRKVLITYAINLDGPTIFEHALDLSRLQEFEEIFDLEVEDPSPRKNPVRCALS